jgi:hypothetical protein
MEWIAVARGRDRDRDRDMDRDRDGWRVFIHAEMNILVPVPCLVLVLSFLRPFFHLPGSRR